MQSRGGFMGSLGWGEIWDSGTGERERKRRGEVWPARAGRRDWCPGTGQAEVLVLTALRGSIQESKIVMCRGEQVVAQRHSKGN